MLLEDHIAAAFARKKSKKESQTPPSLLPLLSLLSLLALEYDGSRLSWNRLLEPLSQLDYDVVERQIQRHQALSTYLGFSKSRNIFCMVAALCDRLTKPANATNFNMSVDVTAKLALVLCGALDHPDLVCLGLRTVVDRIVAALLLDRQDVVAERAKDVAGDAASPVVQEGARILRALAFERFGTTFQENTEFGALVERVRAALENDLGEPLFSAYSRCVTSIRIYREHWYRGWLPLGLLGLDQELLHGILAVCLYALWFMGTPRNDARTDSRSAVLENRYLGLVVRIYNALTRTMLLCTDIDNADETMCGPGTPWRVLAALQGYLFVRVVCALLLLGKVQEHAHDLAHELMNNMMIVFGRKVCVGAVKNAEGIAEALAVRRACAPEPSMYVIDDERSRALDQEVMLIFEYQFRDTTADDDASERSVYVKKEYSARCFCPYDDDEDEDDGDDNASTFSVEDDNFSDMSSILDFDEGWEVYDTSEEILECLDSLSPDRTFFEGIRLAATVKQIEENIRQRALERLEPYSTSTLVLLPLMARLPELLALAPKSATLICDSLLNIPMTHEPVLDVLAQAQPLLFTIDYIHSIVAGTNPRVSLLKAETSTLICKFFTHVQSVVLGYEEGMRAHIIGLMCMMIQLLTREDAACFQKEWTTHMAAQLMLFSWIGDYPEARDLFFEILRERHQNTNSVDTEKTKEKEEETEPSKGCLWRNLFRRTMNKDTTVWESGYSTGVGVQ